MVIWLVLTLRKSFLSVGVSVDAGTMVRPNREKFGYVLYLPSARVNVAMHPKQNYTAQRLEQALALVPLPDEPEPPRKIYEQLYPEFAEDLFTLPSDLARKEYNRRREEQGLERFDPEDYKVEPWEGMDEDEDYMEDERE